MENILKVKIQNEIYGFDADKIDQILIPPSITPVPITDEHILGIASIGGKIIEVIDLSKVLYNKKLAFSKKTKLLKLKKASVVVDEVLEMVEINENEFEESDNELLIGIYKENGDIVQVIDIDKILSLKSLIKFTPKQLTHIQQKEQNSQILNDAVKRVLFFKANNEKFMIDIDILREIIYPPEITPIAKSECLGVITLRDEAINVLSMNELLGFEKNFNKNNRILIANFQNNSIGLLVDEVEAVKNIEISEIENLPNKDEIVEAVYKKELSSLISSNYLRSLIEKYAIEDEDKKEVVKENIVSEIAVFKIANEEFAFDIDEVQEIIKYEEITPIPDVPEIVEGILNLRGVVIPIISLAKRLDLKETITNKTKIIVCNFDESKIGFIVDDVSEILFVEDKFISKAESEEAIFDEVINLDDRIILKIKVKNLLDKETLEKIKIGVESGEENTDS